MKRRTQKKRISTHKKRSNRKINKTKTKKKYRVSRKSSRKTRTKRKISIKKVKQTGGGTSNILTILDILLSKDLINVLPTSQVFDYNKINRYLNMIDMHTLKEIVLSNNYFRKSPTIQSIFKYTAEELQDPNKIKFEIENIDCQDLINDRNMFVKQLFLYLIDCNKEIFIKENVNWYRVICGFDHLDETFEYNVMQSLVEMGVFIKFDEIKEKIQLLEENLDFKLIIKKRIHSCSNKPRGFFDNIFGGVSFKSFKECDKNQKQGVLYLYDEYQRFLTKDIDENLSKLDKVKILIFCETRQHLLSKYLSLEMVRLKDRRINKVKSILENIYKLDKDIIKENDKKLKEFKIRNDNNNVLKKELKKIEDKVDMPYDNIISEEQEIMDKLAEQKVKSDKENEGFDNFNFDIDNKINQVGGGVETPPKFNLSQLPEDNPKSTPVPKINPPVVDPQYKPDKAISYTPDIATPYTPDIATPDTPDTPDIATPDTPDIATPDTPDIATPDTPDTPNIATPDTPDTPDNPSNSNIELPAVDLPEINLDNKISDKPFPLKDEEDSSLSDIFSNDSSEIELDTNDIKEEIPLISDTSNLSETDLDDNVNIPKKIIPNVEKKVVTHEIYNNCKNLQNKFHNTKLVHANDLEKIDGCEKIGLDIFIPPLN